MKAYKFHDDAAHGWLEVPRADIDRAGVAGKISACSYQSHDGATCYLEEDCDASAFLQARVRIGLNQEIVAGNTYNRAPIRNLPRFKLIPNV